MVPSISFIIPTYNAAEHIERCLKSIREQNYPSERIEIIVPDGDSTDNTLDFARKYNCRILQNPKRLAEYGLQLGILNAAGDFIVPFAADNELTGRDWLKRVTDLFSRHNGLSAVWGRLASGKDDSSLNKYFELIQSDPLNWFLNSNLARYKKEAAREGDCFIFNVDPARPLIWGANGIVYKTAKIKSIWTQEGYLGDNDAFQEMIMRGDNKVGYFDSPFVYHHHVARISDWVRKWHRNYKLHFLDKIKTRNLQWVFVQDFKRRLSF
ncbi:MAG: glycosyltransferase family 2 protein, partial [Candidatus Omnitrophota bacterium]|nr:glycosyltransferase family 2 protein [Candidatus Omnitrophota bacterium]